MKGKLISIFTGKIPKCNRSNFFEELLFKWNNKKDGSTYSLYYESELVFFQDTYYASYGLGIVILIVLGFGRYLLFLDEAPMLYIWIGLGTFDFLASFEYSISKII